MFEEAYDMITKEQLNLLCELSKLRIPEEKLEGYAKEMEDIIGLMDTIGESDFEYDPIDMSRAVPFGELRDDADEVFGNMRGIVENSPKTRENQFVVPKVVD